MEQMNNPLSPSRFRSNPQQSPSKTCPRSPSSVFFSPIRRLQWPLSPTLPLRERSSKPTWSLGQAIALAAFCASIAAFMTASSTIVYSDSLHDYEHAQSSRSLLTGSDEDLMNPMALAALPVTQVMSETDSNFTSTVSRPKVAWLMSFPNSGTSFTLHMTREASNTTTATNYALEGDIRNKPSVPVLSGADGEHGPWLELIPGRETTIPDRYILTKTHCKGFCSGRYCGADKMIHTVRSFRTGCLSGTRAIETKRGLEKVDVTYSSELVSRAIHIFRHPLDNVVARFHLEYNVQRARGNQEFTDLFSKDRIGFKRWCLLDDSNRGLLTHRLIDTRLRRLMDNLPCFNEFYRFAQWHNNAFSVSQDMNLPTMVLHYDDYSTDFEATRDKVLNWLELPRVANGVKFQEGKVYRNYYTQEEKRAIQKFLQEFSSAETWKQLKKYDYESNVAPSLNATASVELSVVL